MIEGTPVSSWIGFHIVVLLLLLADMFLLQGKSHKLPARLAWGWTIFLAVFAGAFAFWILRTQGHQPALEFVSGYLIETSLSVDNLFVFLLLFRSFSLRPEDQHRALLWGIGGAILMRALFIAGGVSLLQRFDWIQYVFGGVLLFAALRLLRHPAEAADPSSPEARPAWIRWIESRSASQGSRPGLRTFLLIVLAVEISDLIFALDSIPAVLAVTRRPFIAYTSNIFAILGLRSLFFAVSGFLDRFRLLHYGLAAILAFVALKMLAAHWISIPVTVSLGVILAILAVAATLSLVIPAKRKAVSR
ncbi:MAG TPA: TerC/Alx family metal homeostasis membrane protein [Acidisarcina sp.]|nr:TerC/Alx family metal homeostasis membrane protein [Acidisarcina sp.]